ncbi:hypothetical protein GCK32_010876 [Trichostrongylus colubriformis]|uniref:Uncharacterized protein n=1 Tax=Trichostrongylus colubriformis TaxID=6319 RepID=A0AAN8IRY3_TRICO
MPHSEDELKSSSDIKLSNEGQKNLKKRKSSVAIEDSSCVEVNAVGLYNDLRGSADVQDGPSNCGQRRRELIKKKSEMLCISGFFHSKMPKQWLRRCPLFGTVLGGLSNKNERKVDRTKNG